MHTRSIGPELWMCERGAALCGTFSLDATFTCLAVCLNIQLHAGPEESVTDQSICLVDSHMSVVVMQGFQHNVVELLGEH